MLKRGRIASGIERGVFSVVLALSFIPIIFAVGAAVDLGRAYLVRSRLAYALDAAGLAVGSTQGDEEELEEVLQNFFVANYPDTEMGQNTNLSLSVEDGIVSISATQQIETTFMALANISTLDIGVSVEITRETKGLEVVLVLDNTGSMNSNSKIATLRTAAADLVEILFGDEEAPENLKVSLVPYVTAVNIGRDQIGYVTFDGTPFTGNDATDQSNTGTVWKGCVVEPSHEDGDYENFDYDDVTEFMAYAWPKEPDNCHNEANWNGTGWRTIDETPRYTYGPNMSCPRPIVPLTNDKQLLLDEIDEMMPHSYGGTMAHVGLSWGMRVLSPEEPFTEGVVLDADGMDENGDTWNKAIIILTDGVNQLVTQGSSCRSETDPVEDDFPDGGPYTDYSGQGYIVDDNTLGVASGSEWSMYNAAKGALNDIMSAVCTQAKDQDYLLYTITFQLTDAATRALFEDCASGSDKYFNSPSNDDLQGVFRAIGAELSNLRISG